MMVTGGGGGGCCERGEVTCGVCGRGVGANSVLCTACGKWCHKRCSGLGRLSQGPRGQCLDSGAQPVLGAMLAEPLVWGVVLLVR